MRVGWGQVLLLEYTLHGMVSSLGAMIHYCHITSVSLFATHCVEGGGVGGQSILPSGPYQEGVGI